MKLNKKLALAAFGVVLGATALININNVQSVELSDLQKENLEALAKTTPKADKDLYGTEDGSKFCCKKGSGSCSAADCK